MLDELYEMDSRGYCSLWRQYPSEMSVLENAVEHATAHVVMISKENIRYNTAWSEIVDFLDGNGFNVYENDERRVVCLAW